MKIEDRIQINGTWYVKEDSIKHSSIEPQDPIYTQQCFIELDNCTLEATRIYSDYNNEIYLKHSTSIKYTDKQTKEEECWDSNEWMKHIYNGNEEALEGLPDIFDTDEIEQLKVFIGNLIAIGWLDL